jgi:hypothetical protein
MVKAVRDALASLRAAGSLRDELDRLVDFEEFGRVVDLQHHLQMGDTAI